MDYATSTSERPLSEGVPNPHAPENATVDGNGAAVGEPVVRESVVGEPAVGEPVIGEPAVEDGVPGGEVSETKSRKSGSELFLRATLALGLVSFSEPTCGMATEMGYRSDGLWLRFLKPLWLRRVRIKILRCRPMHIDVVASVSGALVRTLWFGFVIQTILMGLILLVILGSPMYNAAYAYGTQISIFAALATAFAVLGVDQNIYSHNAAQQATGAGWLILAIIDLSWIVFFTSPPQSPVFWVAEFLVARNQEGQQNKVEKIERSADAFAGRRQEARNGDDAFALSALHGGGIGSTRGSRASGPPRLPDQQNPRVTGGDWALYTPPQKSGGRGTITSITSEPKTATASGRVRSAAEESRGSGRRESGRPESGRPESGRPESGSAGPDEALSQNVVAESPKAQWKAQAMFPCMCSVL